MSWPWSQDVELAWWERDTRYCIGQPLPWALCVLTGGVDVLSDLTGRRIGVQHRFVLDVT